MNALHFNISTHQHTQTIKAHENCVSGLALKEASNTIISCSYDKTIKIWDLKTGKLKDSMQPIFTKVNAIALSDKDVIAAGNEDYTVKIWDVSKGKCLYKLGGHEGEITSVGFANEWVVSGSLDGSIKLWDTQNVASWTLGGRGERIEEKNSHKHAPHPVTALVIQNNTIISCSAWDNTIHVWSQETLKCTQQLKGHASDVKSVRATESTIVSASNDKTVKVWDRKSGSCTHTLCGHADNVTSVVLKGTAIFSGSDDKTVRSWDLRMGKQQAELSTVVKVAAGTFYESPVTSLAQEGHDLLAGLQNGYLKIWNV